MNWPLSGNIRRIRRKSLLGELVLLVLGVEMLVFASFTTLQLPTPTQHNLERFVNSTAQSAISLMPARYQEQVLEHFPVLRNPTPAIRMGPYVPLCPVAIFIGYALGLPLGCLAAAIYVVLGMVGTHTHFLVFAAGGGLDYYKEPTFGYILGLILGSWFAARITARNNSSLRQLAAIVGGLACIHLSGLMYLVGGALGLLVFEGEAAYLNWQPWLFESIRNFSWYSLPYDALFTVAAVGIGFPFRWLNAILTAPDIGLGNAKPPQVDREEEFEPELEPELV
jgi:biotin transporter BioY